MLLWAGSQVVILFASFPWKGFLVRATFCPPTASTRFRILTMWGRIRWRQHGRAQFPARSPAVTAVNKPYYETFTKSACAHCVVVDCSFCRCHDGVLDNETKNHTPQTSPIFYF